MTFPLLYGTLGKCQDYLNLFLHVLAFDNHATFDESEIFTNNFLKPQHFQWQYNTVSVWSTLPYHFILPKKNYETVLTTLPHYIPKNYDTKPYHTSFYRKKNMTLGDTQMIATPYLMVVTCGNGNFKLLTQIFAKFSSFFSLAKKILFSEKIFRETFIRRFSFFFAKIFFSFLFCFCHLSCIYSLH